MPNPQIQTRVDDEIADAVDEYAEREQTNKSTAVRQFVLAGMEQMGEVPEGIDTPEAATQPDRETDAYVALSAIGGTLWAAFGALTLLLMLSLAAAAAVGGPFVAQAATTLQMMGLLFALSVGVTVERGRRLARDYGIRHRDVLRLYLSSWFGLPRPDVDVPEEVVSA